MIKFEYFNCNPFNNATNDCVIRAIAICSYFDVGYYNCIDRVDVALHYDKVYKELFEIGYEEALMINDERVYKELLKSKYHLDEIKFNPNEVKVKELKQIGKCMLVNLNGHLTAMIDETVLDTFDCREEYIESVFYYKKM